MDLARYGRLCSALLMLALPLTACQAAPAAPAGAPQQGASGGRSVGIPIPDQTTGLTRSTMMIPAGWHGQAAVDRTSDGLGYGAANVMADLTSADRQSRIQVLAVPFHTLGVSREVAAGMPGNPLGQRNVALTRFTSTADLLTQRIVPALGIAGQVGDLQRPGGQRLAGLEQAKANDRAHGVMNPIKDEASVTIRNGGREVTVFASTVGADGGSPRESTSTQITLVSAPQGRSIQVLMSYFSLQQPPANQAWVRADAQYDQMRTRQINQQSQADSALSQQQTQQIVNTGQANVRAMQQQGAQRDEEFRRRQQAITDESQLTQGRLLNENKSFKWCSATGVVWTVNSAVSPGAGFVRCN